MGSIILISRYCIENYLLDPLLIYATLLDQEVQPRINGIKLDFGEEQKLKSLDIFELQVISDFINQQIDQQITHLTVDDKSLVEIEFVGFVKDIKLKYPQWLLNRSGKELMSFYIQKFQGHYINRDKLMRMYRKLHIIPGDLLRLFEKVQQQ